MSNAREGTIESEGTKHSSSEHRGNPNKKVTRLSAKRKYWVEWECLFDKFPTKDQQEKLKDELKAYIKNYLEQLASGNYELAGGKTSPKMGSDSESSTEPSVIDVIHDEIETMFSDNSQDSQQKLEFSVWDSKSWLQIDEQMYIKAVKENESRESDKLPLKYTLYSKKWIDIFEDKLVHVSDSYLVFSYQGWFETKNRVRLTDASGENRGSMNPPNPPPPPK